jgi:hypothetical protein
MFFALILIFNFEIGTAAGEQAGTGREDDTMGEREGTRREYNGI